MDRRHIPLGKQFIDFNCTFSFIVSYIYTVYIYIKYVYNLIDFNNKSASLDLFVSY